MAYLKPDDVRKMNGDDRQRSLSELRKELVHERGVAAMGGSPPSPGKIRQIRRQIARILTIQNEERLGIRAQTEKVPSPKARTEPLRVPAKGPPAAAAQKAHRARLAAAPVKPKAAAKPKPAAPKKPTAKKPAAKAASAKKTKKEE